jgi:hypothetical protein
MIILSAADPFQLELVIHTLFAPKMATPAAHSWLCFQYSYCHTGMTRDVRGDVCT